MPPSKDKKLYSEWVLFKKREELPETKRVRVLLLKIDFKGSVRL